MRFVNAAPSDPLYQDRRCRAGGPQGLKAMFVWSCFGTAEAVPFPIAYQAVPFPILRARG